MNTGLSLQQGGDAIVLLINSRPLLKYFDFLEQEASALATSKCTSLSHNYCQFQGWIGRDGPGKGPCSHLKNRCTQPCWHWDGLNSGRLIPSITVARLVWIGVSHASLR